MKLTGCSSKLFPPQPFRSMADPREKRVELILQQLEELPTLPGVAVRLLELTGSDSDAGAAHVGA